MFYSGNQNPNMAKLTKGRLAINNRYYIFKCGKGCSKGKNMVFQYEPHSIPLL